MYKSLTSLIKFLPRYSFRCYCTLALPNITFILDIIIEIGRSGFFVQVTLPQVAFGDVHSPSLSPALISGSPVAKVAEQSVDKCLICEQMLVKLKPHLLASTEPCDPPHEITCAFILGEKLFKYFPILLATCSVISDVNGRLEKYTPSLQFTFG